MFAYVDDVFLPKVARIDAAIAETGEEGGGGGWTTGFGPKGLGFVIYAAAAAPHVRSWLDECGLDMDQVQAKDCGNPVSTAEL